jgi:hypothetical protein
MKQEMEAVAAAVLEAATRITNRKTVYITYIQSHGLTHYNSSKFQR